MKEEIDEIDRYLKEELEIIFQNFKYKHDEFLEKFIEIHIFKLK
jgi:hypothetical protein